jgi:transposase
MTLPPDLATLDSAGKDALILVLIARLERLEAENAALRARLGDPPKTPENSSLPPSRGDKACAAAAAAKPKTKPHGGVHRSLPPDPSRRIEATAERCGHCGADVSAVRDYGGDYGDSAFNTIMDYGDSALNTISSGNI